MENEQKKREETKKRAERKLFEAEQKISTLEAKIEKEERDFADIARTYGSELAGGPNFGTMPTELEVLRRDRKLLRGVVSGLVDIGTTTEGLLVEKLKIVEERIMPMTVERIQLQGSIADLRYLRKLLA